MTKLTLKLDEHHLKNAYQLARIAQTVYSDDPAEDFPILHHAFDNVIALRRERISGLVIATESDVVVTFRGRNDNEELIESLAYGQTDWIVGRAHGGFVRLLESVWQELLAALYDVDSFSKNLWLTGHSMGGSLAVLAAQKLCETGFDPDHVITFGSPKVLDEVAAAAFRTDTYRIVNNEDAIPNTGWPTLLDTYAHVGQEVFLLPSGAVAKKRHSPQLARKMDRADTIGEGLIESGPLYDHRIQQYVRKLERHAGSVS